MQSHIVLLLLFAFFVSLVFALLSHDDPKAQLRFGALLFGGFIVAAIVLGWLMYPFPIQMKLWLPVAAYMAVIFVFSSIPNPPTVSQPGSDKVLHILLYGGLAALVVRAAAGGFDRPVTMRTVIIAVVVSALYGAADEVHQHFVPPRQMDVWDLAADSVGAAASALALYAAHAIRRE